MLYVGTHRRAHRADPEDTAFGIYSFHGTDAGEWQSAGLQETIQPGWLALGKAGPALYAVNEVREMNGAAGASVSAFSITPESGELAFINSRPLPPMPCHCTVDGTGRFLLVATFGGGSVHVFPIGQDGALGEECDRHVHVGSSAHPQRQTSPHAHAVVPSPDNRFVLVPDLGTDKVVVYAFDSAKGQLIVRPENTLALPPLSGPRHAVFSSDARFVYLVNEMSATLTVCAWDSDAGTLAILQSLDLLPDGFEGLRSGSAIVLHPDDRRLFVTTRSHGSSGMPAKPGLDLLVCVTVNPDNGLAEIAARLPSGGGIPRSIALMPDGRHLLIGHQCSGTVISFSLEGEVPETTGHAIATPVPVCLLFGI